METSNTKEGVGDHLVISRSATRENVLPHALLLLATDTIDVLGILAVGVVLMLVPLATS